MYADQAVTRLISYYISHYFIGCGHRLEANNDELKLPNHLATVYTKRLFTTNMIEEVALDLIMPYLAAYSNA